MKRTYAHVLTVRLREIDDARLQALALDLGDVTLTEAIRTSLREACERRSIERVASSNARVAEGR